MHHAWGGFGTCIHYAPDLSTVPWLCRGSPAFFNCLPPIPVSRDPLRRTRSHGILGERVTTAAAMRRSKMSMFGLAASLQSSRHVHLFDIHLSCDALLQARCRPCCLSCAQLLCPLPRSVSPACIHNAPDLSTIPWLCRGSLAFFIRLPPIPVSRDPPTDAVTRDLGRESERV